MLAAAFAIQLVHYPLLEAKILLVSKVGVDNADCSVSACLTVQHAINQSASGDTVLVAAGTYIEAISHKSGVSLVTNAAATIQGSVNIQSTGPGTILEGFTITGSRGVTVIDSTAEIRRNYIINNSGGEGGIYTRNSFVSVVNNLIAKNLLSLPGAGIAIEGGSVSIINNTIHENNAGINDGEAVWIAAGTDYLFQNNIFSGHLGSSLILDLSTNTSRAFKHNLFFNSVSVTYSNPTTGQAFGSGGSLNFTVSAESFGNIDGNPAYVSNDDFHVSTASFAIDLGLSLGAPTVDIDGDVRPQGIGVDIGFDEFLAAPPPPPPPPPPSGVFCDSTVNTIPGLQTEVGSLTTSSNTIDTLTRILGSVSAALQGGDLETARSQLANFIRTVVRYSNKKETAVGLIPLVQATHVICGAANVMTATAVP